MDNRVEPAPHSDERTILCEFLDFQRATFEWKIVGLERDQLVEHHVPSKTTLLGILKHLIDVEHWWFTVVFDGQPDTSYFWERDGVFDSEFDISPDDDFDEILMMYRRECAQSRAIVEAAPSLDDIAAHPDKEQSLRWIMVHMIEETARHVGHADIFRELADGETGE